MKGIFPFKANEPSQLFHDASWLSQVLGAWNKLQDTFEDVPQLLWYLRLILYTHSYTVSLSREQEDIEGKLCQAACL